MGEFEIGAAKDLYSLLLQASFITRGSRKKEEQLRSDIFGLFFYIAQHMTLVSHEEEMIPFPLSATLI